MLKRLLLFSVTVLMGFTASAQFMYTFKDTTTPYAPLTGGTSMNGSSIWDDETFWAQIPFTWRINGSITTNVFFMALGLDAVIADTNDFSHVNGFILSNADIADRGGVSGSTSLSPVRYTTAGLTPNRIFKVEVSNAGFYEEWFNHTTMSDFVNTQIWVYESSNIVELHFGPSQITYASEYFGTGQLGPITGFFKDVDLVSGASGSLYYLKGNPAAPTLDSLLSSTSAPSTVLSSWPADGKVYRFTPKQSGVGVAKTPVHLTNVLVYPTLATTDLRVTYMAGKGETASYQIRSLTGALIGTGQLQAGTQSIDVSALAAGNYYLQVNTKDGSGNYRFVKQ